MSILQKQVLNDAYLLTQTIDWFIWINASNLVGNSGFHSLFLGLFLPCRTLFFLLHLTHKPLTDKNALPEPSFFCDKSSIFVVCHGKDRHTVKLYFYESSAIAEMADHGHNRQRPKRGKAAVPLVGGWVPI